MPHKYFTHKVYVHIGCASSLYLSEDLCGVPILQNKMRVVASFIGRLTCVVLVKVRPLLLSPWCVLPSTGDSDSNLCISLSASGCRFFLLWFGLVCLLVRTHLIKLVSTPQTDRGINGWPQNCLKNNDKVLSISTLPGQNFAVNCSCGPC